MGQGTGVGSPRRAFATAHRSGYRPLVVLTTALSGRAVVGRAVVDDAFRQVWRSWPASGGVDDALDRIRRTAVSAPALDHAGPVRIAGSTADAMLLAALRELPMAQRQAVVLHHMGGVPAARVAGWCAISPDEVRSRLEGGLDALVGHVERILSPPAADLRSWTTDALAAAAGRLDRSVVVTPAVWLRQQETVDRWARRVLPVLVTATCGAGVTLISLAAAPAGPAPGPAEPLVVAGIDAGVGAGSAPAGSPGSDAGSGPVVAAGRLTLLGPLGLVTQPGGERPPAGTIVDLLAGQAAVPEATWVDTVHPPSATRTPPTGTPRTTAGTPPVVPPRTTPPATTAAPPPPVVVPPPPSATDPAPSPSVGPTGGPTSGPDTGTPPPPAPSDGPTAAPPDDPPPAPGTGPAAPPPGG